MPHMTLPMPLDKGDKVALVAPCSPVLPERLAFRAVVVVRGGYGGARLAELLDYDTIRANPKVFTGFSDATVLHVLINQRCSLVTFHAPMPAAANFRDDEFTHIALADALAGNWTGKYENSHPERNAGIPLECLFEGRGEGILTGGNLTIVASTAGTPYQLDCAAAESSSAHGWTAPRLPTCR